MKYPRRKSKEFTSNTAYQLALRVWRVWNRQRIIKQEIEDGYLQKQAKCARCLAR